MFMKGRMQMLLLFFLAWVIFNGRFTLEIALFGVAVSALVFGFICKFMDYSLAKERTFYKKLPLFCKYVLLLLREIGKANLAVCRLILTRKEVVEPVLVKIHTNLKSEVARVMLANSITLTPGTITVSLKDQELLVHCLDKTLAEGMEDSEFVKLLEALEREVN
jgi:multicomponent Na+:H+ antiporter subunit E